MIFIILSPQEFTVTNAASVVVLARAKNIVGHMPILHGMFRSARSTEFLSHKLFGNWEAEVGIRNTTAISKYKSRAPREVSLFLWNPGA